MATEKPLPLSELRRRYEAGEPSTSLARAFSISWPTVLAKLRRMGVRIRTNSEAHKGQKAWNSDLGQPYLEARFWAKVKKTATCWLWTGGKNHGGYGQFWRGPGKTRMAHRTAYEFANGAIPPELSMDHLCRTPPCVRPDHMEAVPIRVNILRSDGITAKAHRQAACIHGHPFTPENTYVWNGTRTCRTCRRVKGKRYDDKRRAKAALGEL